jgi:hypothetical protein
VNIKGKSLFLPWFLFFCGKEKDLTMGSKHHLFSLTLLVSCLLLTEGFQLSLSQSQSRKFTSLQLTTGQNDTENKYVPVPTRREIFVGSASFALSNLLLGARPVSALSPLNIVMTGANSGIGFESCKQLAAQGHSIVMACRTLTKAQEAIQRIRESGTSTGTLTPAECDLTNLQSIQKFSNDLSLSSIDALSLNAGIARNTAATDCARTVDGFELTGMYSKTWSELQTNIVTNITDCSYSLSSR